MSKRAGRFDLAAAPEVAARACRRALGRMGWELLEQSDGRLVAEEDPARLCCVISPVKAEIRLGAVGDGRTTVDLDCSIPGLGPIQTRQLVDRMRALEAGIRACA